MVQRRQHARFTLESRNTFGIVAERFRETLDRNTAAELRVVGLIYVTHSAGSNVTCDFVVCEFRADHSVNEIWRRILSNHRQVIHLFEGCDRTTRKGNLSWRVTAKPYLCRTAASH